MFSTVNICCLDEPLGFLEFLWMHGCMNHSGVFFFGEYIWELYIFILIDCGIK